MSSMIPDMYDDDDEYDEEREEDLPLDDSCFEDVQDSTSDE